MNALAIAWSFVWSADFLGMGCGVAGTLLLALRGRLAGWGFVAYLASNAGWILFALDHGHVKLLVQHAVFAVSSVIGVWVWLIRPERPSPAGDTQLMEDEIVRHVMQLAQRWNLTLPDVVEIVQAHGGAR